MTNFPYRRGVVAGILKGYFHLSAVVYSSLYSGLLRHSPSSFLLFLTFGLPAICFAMMYFVRPCTPSAGENSYEDKYFSVTKCSMKIFGLYLLGTAVSSNVFKDNDAVFDVLLLITVILFITPFVIFTLLSADSATYKNNTKQLLPITEIDDRIIRAEIVTKSLPTETIGRLLAEGEGALIVKR